MPSKIIYERYLWFHDRVKAGKHPNAGNLAEKFELSRKTAHRDITFMRDRLHAPLVYVPDKRGYAYAEKTYTLPRIWLGEEELGALFISTRLASTIPDRGLKASLTQFLEQIVSAHTFTTPVSLEQLEEKISVKNIEYARVDEGVFHYSNTSIKEYIRKNFGLLNKDARMEVCLKFAPAIMPWVSEQVWHAEQEQTVYPDGSLCLTFPVADLREVKREILKFGSEVAVLSPEALRMEVKAEIDKMKKIYR